MSRPRHELLPQGVQPLALRQGAMAAALGLSETTFKEMQQQGLFPPPRIWQGILFCIVEENKAALYALPVEQQAEITVFPSVTEKTWRVK